MIYGFSLLFGVLSLVLGIPAGKQLLRMREIDRNPASTHGQVVSTKSAMGWLWAAGFGNQDRPLVTYTSPKGTEMVYEIVTSNVLPAKNYLTDQAIEIIYDKDFPGRAYATPEKKAARQDLFGGLIALAFSIILWIFGQATGMPF
jgi:hypothetical protein